MVGVAIIGMVAMFVTSWGLSRTVLKGEASTHYTKLPTFPRTIERFRAALPDVKTLIVSGHGAGLYGRAAAHVGAHGYVMKDDPQEILEAIRVVAEGGTYDAAGRRGS